MIPHQAENQYSASQPLPVLVSSVCVLLAPMRRPFSNMCQVYVCAVSSYVIPCSDWEAADDVGILELSAECFHFRVLPFASRA